MFAIPTLKTLVEQCRAAFRAELPGSDAWLWPNNIGPTAKVIAAGLSELYGRLDYVQRQKFALTADGEWLDRHGAEIGMARLSAAPASGMVLITATGAITVASGATLTRSDGVVFSVPVGGALVASGTLTLPAVAVASGKAGVTLAGATLQPTSGITGTTTIVVDGNGLSGGADVEGDDAFRARILFRKRNPPSGGSAADYVMWAQTVPGVTRVYIERLWAGPGTVRVFPVTDGATGGGIPSASVTASVAAVIDAVRPVGAVVTVSAPAPFTIDVGITGLSPATVTVKEAIVSELRDLFTRRGRVSGSEAQTALSYLASGQTFSRSWVWQAVANAAGEDRHTIVVPFADVTIPAGAIPVLGAITFA